MNTWRVEHSSFLPARGFPIVWNKLLLWYSSLLVGMLICLDSSFLLPCKYDAGLWAHVTVFLSDCSFLLLFMCISQEEEVGSCKRISCLGWERHHPLKCVPSRITILLVWVNRSKMVPSVSQQGHTESFLAMDVESSLQQPGRGIS